MSIKIFANPSEGVAAIGSCTPVPVTHLPDWALEILRGKSAATAFIHTDIPGDDDTSDIEALDRAIQARRECAERLTGIIADGTVVELRIGSVEGDDINAIPLDASLYDGHTRFVMQLREYNSRFRSAFGDITPGSNVRATLVSADASTVRWTFVDKINSEQRKRDAAEFNRRLHVSRIFQELQHQAGKVFLQCRITGTIQITSEKGTSEHYKVSFGGIEQFAVPYCTAVDRMLCQPDGTIVLHLNKIANRDGLVRLRLSTSWSKSAGLPHTPEGGFDRGGVSSVVGRPHRFFSDGNCLVTVLFDGNTWQNDVFLNHMLAREVDNISAYPSLAYRYISLGYPCTFALDLNRFQPEKSRLLLSGLALDLEGRLPSEIELLSRRKAGDIAAEVAMAPAALDGDCIKMVSAGYTAFMPLGQAPEALRIMARSGIFSPDFKVRCDISLKRIDADDRWRVVCRPSLPSAALPAPGSKVQATVCAALCGMLYLMAGDRPASCYVEDLSEEMAILDGSARVEWIVANVDRYGILTLRPIRAAVVDSAVMPAFGQLFTVGEGMDYYGRQVIDLPAGGEVARGTRMMCLRADADRLIAASDFGRLSDELNLSPERLSIVACGLEYGLLLGRRHSGRLIVQSLDDPIDSIILRRLCDLYGDDATFVGRQDSTCSSFRTIWTGIACQHDYSALRGTPDAKVAELWLGLGVDTPVLFGDICLSLDDLPAMSVAAAPADTSAAESSASGSDDLFTVVKVSAAGPVVTLERDGRRLTLTGSEQLRLPFPRGKKAGSITPIQQIFAPGSLWAVDFSDPDNPCMRADESDTPHVYTLVAPLLQTSGSDWVVRSDDGAIAVASDLDDPVAGRRVLMTTENVLGPYVYVEEAEEQFVGRKLRLAVVEVTDSALVCRELTGAVTRRIELPAGLVSWNPRWTPRRVRPGTVLSARVIEARADRLVVDRRCLLRQDALIPGIKPEPGSLYQMEVTEVSPGGYVLSQNGVRAVLPLHRAALFEITPRTLSYLRVDDLVAVTVSRRGDNEADRIGDTARVARAWAESGVMQTFAVHHHCADGIFVERDGIVMYVSNRALGHWCGRPLVEEYAVGSVISLKVTETAAGRFELGLVNVPPLAVAPPEPGKVYEGTVTDVLPGVGCYVAHPDGWSAFVPADKVSRRPRLARGRLAAAPGDKTTFAVTAVTPLAGTIDADISVTLPVPVSGPGSAEAYVEVFRDVIERTDTHIVLADRQGYLATVIYDEHDTPALVEDVAQNPGGLLVTGMHADGTMAASAAALLQANADFAEQFKASTEPVPVDATVIGFSKNTVILCYGSAIGMMPRQECDPEPDADLSKSFEPGQIVSVLIYKLGIRRAFMASALRRRRLAAASEAQSYTPGTRLKMRVTGADAAGVRGRVGNVDVLVPTAEINLAPGATLAAWAESRVLVDVTATSLAGDGTLLASRRRCVGDIPER